VIRVSPIGEYSFIGDIELNIYFTVSEYFAMGDEAS
jgi:hypothetical protein